MEQIKKFLHGKGFALLLTASLLAAAAAGVWAVRCNVGHGLLPCGILLCVPVRFCFRGGLLGGAGGV